MLLLFNVDYFCRDFILVVSLMYVLYVMKLFCKYSNDVMLCFIFNFIYVLIYEVIVEKF